MITTNLLAKVLGIVAVLAAAICVAHANDPKFTHTLSWGSWKGTFESDADVTVFWDGKPFGPKVQAYKKLESVDVGPEDRIRIEIPTETKLDEKEHPCIYSSARFLGIWLANGVRLKFFQGDKAYELHTLTWTKYLREKGGWKPDLTTAHLVLDGKDIGEMAAALKSLESLNLNGKSLLQIYSPYASWEVPRPELAYPEGLLAAASNLAKRSDIPFEVIMPTN